MVISLAHKFIYVANLKVASTSTIAALKPYAEIALDRSEYGKHITLSDILRRFSWVFDYIPRDDFIIFGAIRDPLEYIRSLYNSHKAGKFKERSDIYTGNMDFKQFIDTWCVNNADQVKLQYLRFVDSQKNLGVDYLIDYSKISVQLPEVINKIGLPGINLPSANVSPTPTISGLIDSEMKKTIDYKYFKDSEILLNHTGRWLI